MSPWFWIWVALSTAFLLIEILTVQVVTIWFALGAVAAVIANAAGASLFVQWAVFLAVSVASLLLGRTVFKKYLKRKPMATNADMCIGEVAVVTAKIDNEAQTGSVKVKGMEWTARSSGITPIEQGQRVKVLSIQGVKLIVEKAE